MFLSKNPKSIKDITQAIIIFPPSPNKIMALMYTLKELGVFEGHKNEKNLEQLSYFLNSPFSLKVLRTYYSHLRKVYEIEKFYKSNKPSRLPWEVKKEYIYAYDCLAIAIPNDYGWFEKYKNGIHFDHDFFRGKNNHYARNIGRFLDQKKEAYFWLNNLSKIASGEWEKIMKAAYASIFYTGVYYSPNFWILSPIFKRTLSMLPSIKNFYFNQIENPPVKDFLLEGEIAFFIDQIEAYADEIR
jgi:hypothetical protein